MAELDESSFESKYNNAGTGLYRTGQSRGIGSDDHRSLVTDVKDSVLFTSKLLTNTSVVTTGGTITLGFANTRDRIFYGASSFSTSKEIALSNDSNAKRLTFIFEITDTAAILTFPSSFRMSDAMWGANGAYTWQALDVGTYKAKAEFDGTLWYLDMFGPYGFIT